MQKGFKFLCYFYICYLRGLIKKLSILYGNIEFFAAISIAAFSNELKGLSRIMHCTFGFRFLDWLNTIAAPPIDLPHKIYFLYYLVTSRAPKMAFTSSCYLSPYVVWSPSLLPLPEKSKEQK